MGDLQQLESIYREYEEKLAQAEKQAGLFAGAFNMGDDPRKDVCNQMFYEALGQWVRDFLKTDPNACEVSQAAEWILNYPALHRENGTYWMAYAAQGHARELIPLLEREEAGRLARDYGSRYPRRDRMPVQRELMKALSDRAGGSGGGKEREMLGTWLPRVVLLLIGLTIAHLGVTLFLLANLGSDPFNVLIQGLHELVPAVTHGTVHIAVSLLIILALLVIDRSYVRIGTFLCMLLGGPIIDLFNLLLGGIVSAGSPMVVRVMAVVLGCGILAFGMTIVIKSQAGTGPNDLVAVVLSDKTKWKFGPVRVGVDVLFALTGFLLGGTVGPGTLICMAVVGPVAQMFMPLSERICDGFTARVRSLQH